MRLLKNFSMQALLLPALALALALALTLVCVSVAETETEYVVTLTDQNADDLLAGDNHTPTSHVDYFIEFYAPWCGHCKALAPVWENLAYQLKAVQQRQDIKIAKVDCTSEKQLAKQFGIKSFPTLIYYRDGQSRVYKGSRSQEDLASYIVTMGLPPVQNLDNANLENLENSKAKSVPTFLLLSGIGKDTTTSKQLEEIFEETARKWQGIAHFYRWDSPELSQLSAVHITMPDDHTSGALVLSLLEGEDNEFFLTKLSDKTVVANRLDLFVRSRQIPLIASMDRANFEELTGLGRKLVYIVIDYSHSSPEGKKLLEQLYPVAKRLKSKFTFATLDYSKYAKYLQQFGINENHANALPQMVVLDYPDYFFVSSHVELQKSIEPDEIEAFLGRVDSGEVESRAVIPWYSPKRYMQKLNRWMSEFSEWQLIAGSSAFSIIVFLLILYFVNPSTDASPSPTHPISIPVPQTEQVPPTRPEVKDSNETPSSSSANTRSEVRKRK